MACAFAVPLTCSAEVIEWSFREWGEELNWYWIIGLAL